MLGRMSVFTICGRDPVNILMPVLITEKCQEDVATLDFGEIQFIGSLVTGWETFKQENFSDKFLQKWIAKQKCLQIPPDIGKFVLNAADEDFQAGRWHCDYFAGAFKLAIILTNCPSTFALKSPSIS